MSLFKRTPPPPDHDRLPVYNHPDWWIVYACPEYAGGFTHYHGPDDRCYWKYDYRHYSDRQIERWEREAGRL